MNKRNQSPLWKTVIAIVLAGLVVSCQPTPAPTQYIDNSEIQDVRVQTAEPIKNTSKVEQFPLPNCGGSDNLGQSLGTFASVSKSATVGGTATVTGGGEVAIPATAKLKLEIQVELAYQQTFESANSRLDTIEMSAAAGTHVVYTIVWEEQTFNSIVQYSSDGKVYEVPYTYVLSVPKIDKSYNVVCDETSETAAVPATQPPPVLVVTRVQSVITVIQPTSAPPTAIPPTEVPPTSPPTLQITTFTVFANQAWQDTGITVNPGDVLTIQYISGLWRWTGDRADYDGNGDPAANGTYLQICTTNYDCPITDAPLEALIGKIGASGTPFLIGNGITITVPNEAGNNQRLYLVGNDSFSGLHDNVGSIEVSIAK
jgi:hypothetical protein